MVSRQLPPRKVVPRLGLGFGSGLVSYAGTWLICHKYRSTASNIINLVNELPHKLPNKLRVRI